MEKEVIKAGLNADPISKLEKTIGESVRENCGLKIRTFEYMSDLQDIKELRIDNPVQKGSGFIRADVMEAFYLSMRGLIGKCQIYFALNDEIDMTELVLTYPAQDRFLNLLNKKKFDDIHEYSENPLRLKQYNNIKNRYFDDREILVNNLHRKYLKGKKLRKKVKLIPYILGAPILAAVLAGAAAQIATYFQVGEIRSTAESAERQVYTSTNMLEERLKPENIIQEAETYLKSEEGKEYVQNKYIEFKIWWEKENLAAKQLDVFWEKKVAPVLSNMNSPDYDKRRARIVVAEFKKEYPGLDEAAKKLSQMLGVQSPEGK